MVQTALDDLPESGIPFLNAKKKNGAKAEKTTAFAPLIFRMLKIFHFHFLIRVLMLVLIFGGIRGFAQEPIHPGFVIDGNANVISGAPGEPLGSYFSENSPDASYMSEPRNTGFWNFFRGNQGPSILAAPEQGSRASTSLSGASRGRFLQKIYASALWTPDSKGDFSLGFTQVDLSATFAVPFFTEQSPLLITPGISTWFTKWKWDPGFETDRELYTANCELRWVKPLYSSKYILELGASPGWSSDFKAGSGDAFRIPAHIGGIWNYNPRVQVILGCSYLDRSDYDWLPFGGIIWTPEDLEMRFEILFPNPKISKRIRWWGSAVGDDVSDWIYAGGELGGGCWNLEGWDERDISVAYRDYRVLLGYERKSVEGINFAIEVGGMFNRKTRFSPFDHEDASIDSAVFLRLKAHY